MSAVSSLSIVGYKSIRELRDFKLNNLNVLIGANGAGKSNLIGLFRFLNQICEQQLQLYVQKQGGPDALLHFGRETTDALQFMVCFDSGGYSCKLSPTVDNRLIVENESIWFGSDGFPDTSTASIRIAKDNSMLLSPNKYPYEYTPVRETIRDWHNYHFGNTSDSAKVKRLQAGNDNLHLKSDAANLAAYLRMLHEKHPSQYMRIVETIRLVAPFFDDFIHRPLEQEYIELEWKQRGKPDTPFKAHMLSDGTLRFICLATLLLQPIELLPDTVIIDEPELGLHPYAVTVLAEILKQISDQRQLILSTQSVELVNELSPKDVVVVDYEDDASVFRRFSENELSCWLAEYSLGELWKRNILGGRP
jgi:predicted ATPase